MPRVLGGAQSAVIDLNAALTAGTEYYSDVMIRDPQLSDTTTFSSASLRPDGAADATGDEEIAAELRWSGRQGIFPLAYRGWAVAGYNAGRDGDATPIDHDRVRGHFGGDIRRNQPTPPDPGWGDISASDPSQEDLGLRVPARSGAVGPSRPADADLQAPGVGRHPGQPGRLRRRDALLAPRRRQRHAVADASGGAGRAVTRVEHHRPEREAGRRRRPGRRASFGFSPSFGLVDYEDMNGDGYPDIITPSSVTYTDPARRLPAQRRQSRRARRDQPGPHLRRSAPVSSAAWSTSRPTPRARPTPPRAARRAKAATPTTPAAASASPPASTRAGPAPTPPRGATARPIRTPTYADQLGEINSSDDIEGLPGDTAPIQLGLADVNGDGLPDRVFTTPSRRLRPVQPRLSLRPRSR